MDIFPTSVDVYMKKVNRLTALGKLLEATNTAMLGEEPQTRARLQLVKEETITQMKLINKDLKRYVDANKVLV